MADLSFVKSTVLAFFHASFAASYSFFLSIVLLSKILLMDGSNMSAFSKYPVLLFLVCKHAKLSFFNASNT